MFNNFLSKLTTALFTAVLTVTASWAQNTIPQLGDRIETDNGIYVVKGANLIPNNTFDQGLEYWTNGTGTDLTDDKFQVWADGGVDGGNCLKALSSAGSSSTSSLRTGWAVTEGKTYLLSFWAYRTQVDGNAQYSRICLANTQTGSDNEIAKVKYEAKTWVQNQVVFTADKPFCVAAFSWLNTTTAFDEFYLGELEVSADLATAKLESTIANAQLLLASTEEGDLRGQYTTANRAALQAAIDAAETALNGATTQQEINDAVTALSAAVKAYENSKNPPFKVGEQYTFTNVAGSPLVLSSGGDGGTVKIAAEGVDNTTVFTFVPAPEDAAAAGYNLKDADGNFIYRSGSWDTKASSTADLTAANAIFQIVDYDSYVQIKNMGSGSVLGTDNNTEGSAVYSNKNGGDNRYRWVMSKFVPADQRDEKYYFDIELESALKTYSEINTGILGTSPFKISASAYDALTAALAEVQAMTDYAAAREKLAAAMEQWTEAKSNQIAPAEGTTFYITHKSGKKLYQQAGSTQPVIYQADEETEQTFSFIPTDVPNYYLLQNNETGSYLFHPTSNAWDTSWSVERPTSDQGLWKVEAYADTLYSIKNRYTGGYLGTDATTSGASIYCDKAASSSNSQWNVSDGSDRVQIDRTAYAAVLENAQTQLAAMREGYHVGEYYQNDIDAFKAVIAAAEAEAKKIREQGAFDAFVAQFEADVQAYAAKAHTESVAPQYLAAMIEECQAEHDAAVVGIEKGQYSQEAVDRYAVAIDAARNNSNAEAAIQALTEARATFQDSQCIVDRAKFSATIASAQKSADDAVAGDCDGQYPQDAIDALKSAIATAREAYIVATATQADIDAALEELNAEYKTFQQARVTIDFSDLRDAIAAANTTIKLAEPEKGEGPGHYPVSAFEVLQAVIARATDMMGSKTVNQNAVSDMVVTVEDAIAVFDASRVENDYSELDALLAYAQQIYDKAVAENSLCAEDLEALAESIAKGQAARKSYLQDDIDRAVKILRRDTELYSDLMTGIVSLDKLGSYSAIYTLSGVRVTHPIRTPGLYIIGGRKVVVK